MKTPTAVLSLLALPILPLSAQIRITEVMSSSAHTDTSANGDWFEITNTGGTAVNIGGYSFDDDSNTPGSSGTLPSFSLAAGASLIVLRENNATNFRNLWNISATIRIITEAELTDFPGFGGNGDAVSLFNSSNGLVDTFSFGSATAGRSFARFENGDSVPGGLSTDGLFGAYESDDPTEDIGSPGSVAALPDPLPPIFTEPFLTSAIVGAPLANLDFRVRADDPNPGDTVSFTVTDQPDWLTITDNGDGTATLNGSAPADAIGVQNFTIEAMDNTGRSSTQIYTLNILPATSPVILNEYNAVANNLFLGGGDADEANAPTDSTLGRVAGNGGPWVEFYVTGPNSQTGDVVDLRGWTILIESDNATRRLKLSQNDALSEIYSGTILTFTANRDTADTFFNGTSSLTQRGYTWTNIWMFDPLLIDQDASEHPSNNPALGSNNTRVTLLNASDTIVYGPSGESIGQSDSDLNGVGDDLLTVGDTEVYKLEAEPTANTTPLAITYDDGNSSSFGAPNLWSSNTMTQVLTPYRSPSTPPDFAGNFSRQAARGTYNETIAFGDPNGGSPTIEVFELPDFLDITVNAGSITLTNLRPLTQADVGKYEVTLRADNGEDTNFGGYLSFELEVLDPAPALILNEYNAVSPTNYLNGGTAEADSDGGALSTDTHFNRVVGNGGDWFELAVVGDGEAGSTNLVGWTIEIGKSENGQFDPTTIVELQDEATWSSVANGTLLTFIDEDTAGGGLDTGLNRVNELATSGYAWSNIYLGTPDIISAVGLGALDIDSNSTQFVIKNDSGTIVFGPAGEGIAPASGVGSSEIFELEGDPSPLIASIDESSATMAGYDDGSSGSTFGSPNLFTPVSGTVDRAQDFTAYLPGTFADYLADLGLTGASETDDSDSDGFNNLDEYLLGGNAADSSIFPVTILDPTTGTISFNVRTSDPNFTLVGQRSPNLDDWFEDDLTTEESASSLGANFALRSITYDGSASKMFFRMATPGAD